MAIPKYEIIISQPNLRELRADIWNDDPLPASLKAGNKRNSIDLAYRGSHIREFKKKSYHIAFGKNKSMQTIKEIHLNAEYKDPSIMRNKLSLDFFTAIGCLSPSSKHVQLYLNGRYEGVYLQLESVDDNFLKRRGLPKGPIFYAVNDDANFSLISPLDNDVKERLDSGYERKAGSNSDSWELGDFIYKINTTAKNEFENMIVNHLDVEKYFRWLAGVVCTQNYDGFVHNYSLYKNSGTGLFEIMPWDYDATWGRDIHGEKMECDYVRVEGFNTLTARLLECSNLRNHYYSILGTILENQFTIGHFEPIVRTMHNLLRPYVAADPYISNRMAQFDKEPDYILNFLADRRNYLLSKLKEK